MVQSLSSANTFLSWLTLLRLGATARGILPYLLGAVIAWSQGYAINWLILILSSLAVLCVMAMTFLINEYYDYETDTANKDCHRLSGGSRILPLGFIPRRHALIGAYVFTGIAAVIGLCLYLGLKTGPLTIPLGLLAVIIGYTYTARPFRLAYRGLGELSIWFTCGWLATSMGYYLQTGQFNNIATLASLPGGFSVFMVILMNEIPDITSDKLFGKKNLAVRLGKEKTAALYLVAMGISFTGIITAVFFGAPVASAYLSVLLVPLMIWIILTLRQERLGDKQVQESLSIKTMLYDHLITIIYAVSFVIEGFKVDTPDTGQLLVLTAAFVIVFGLEGLSLAASKATISKAKTPASELQLIRCLHPHLNPLRSRERKT